MPLTAKGREILAAMTKEYGEKRGKSVFYASKNAGKITGVDAVETPAAENDPDKELLDAIAARVHEWQEQETR